MDRQKGINSIEALLLTLIATVIVFTGWYVLNSRNRANKSYQNANLASNTGQSQPKKAQVATISGWVLYSSQRGMFSLQYPRTWVQPTDRNLCTVGLLDRSIYLGPDKASVLKCGTGFLGQMSVISVAGDMGANYQLTPSYTSHPKQTITVDGVKGEILYGVAGPTVADDPYSPIQGTIQERYIFYSRGNTYIATYTQAPQGHAPSTDVKDDFEKMITKTLKFSS